MAKWDLSKLPEGRKPLPDEWFLEKVQMQERIAELEADNKRLRLEAAHANDTADVAIERAKELEDKLVWAMEYVADYSNDPHLVEWANANLAQLKGEKDE